MKYLGQLSLLMTSLLVYSMSFVQAETLVAASSHTQACFPPQATKVKTERVLHGDIHCDDYAWLRNKDDPSVLTYLRAWNHYTATWMQPTQPLQDLLYRELMAASDKPVASVPYRLGQYEYYERQEPSQDYPLFCRRHLRLDAKEDILVDLNQTAKGQAYFKLLSIVPSPNGRFLAISTDTVGTQYATLIFKDCLTGEMLGECLADTNGQVVWSSDSQGVWYIRVDASFREYQVRFHVIGTTEEQDRVVLEEKDSLYAFDLKSSSDQRFVFMTSMSIKMSEVYYLRANDPLASPKLIHPKEEGLCYFIEAWQDQFYIRTQHQQGGDAIYVTAIQSPSKDNWKQLRLQNPASAINQIVPFKNHLVIETMQEGLKRLEIWDLLQKQVTHLHFNEAIYAFQLEDHLDFNSSHLRFTYSSFLCPPATYSYDLQTGYQELLRQKVMEQFDPHLYQSKRLYAQAQDGTQIPLSLFYKKGMVPNGSHPLLLLGYGAYGSTLEGEFLGELLPLIDRGFIFAIAHVRGGGERGLEWYQQGRLFHKKNTFTDFICCAEDLIEKGYTSSQKLVICGRSAGGLLVGAVINMRSDLFKAAVAEVPFVDVINTLLDQSLPLTTQEEEEWGTPYRVKDYFYIKSYSPYDNVQRATYPSLLITGGFHDAQVAYWEPVKWAAKLLDHKTDQNPLLLKVNLQAGHQSASTRQARFKEMAFKYAFILNQVGINK